MPTPYRRNAQTPAGRIAATPGTANWGGFFGLLQEYSGASAGYSLRKIGSGPVVRLRRASDNAEKGFYASEVVAGTAGSELVVNGDFATDSVWSKGAGWSITGGQAVCDGSQVVRSTFTQNGIYGGDVIHIVTFDVVACSNFAGAGTVMRRGTVQSFSVLSNITSPGTYTRILSSESNASFGFYADAGVTLTLDNVSLKTYTASSAESWAVVDSTLGTRGITGSDESAFCTTWYDQSGSGNDATQAVSTAQPLLIRAGVTHTVNGKAALSFDGVDDELPIGAIGISGSDNRSVFSVVSPDAYPATDGGGYLGIEGPVGLGSAYDHCIESGQFALRVRGNALYADADNNITQRLWTTNLDGTTAFEVELFKDGTSVARTGGTDRTLVGVDDWVVGATPSQPTTNYDGSLQEIIIYPSDQSANRTGIETNINDHYGIY